MIATSQRMPPWNLARTPEVAAQARMSDVKQQFWTLPNTITSLRVLATAPVILLIVSGETWALWAALCIMVLSEFSDWIDGVLARRRGQVSNIGKLLDPMADSLYRVSVFTAFTANHWMPLWMLLIIICRDVSVSYLRVLAEQKKGTMGARQSGKWKAVAQSIAQLVVVAGYAMWGPDMPDLLAMFLNFVLLVATAVTAYSLLDYAASVFRDAA
jgi:CDP-diacylglycerol--glycerol-3-phosphate 3-phosphatidyltransferase